MENEEIKEDQGMKLNAKNRIIAVVTREMKAGMLITNKQSQNSGKNSEKSFFPQTNSSDRRVTWVNGTNAAKKGEKSNKIQNEQNTGNNASILKGSYTQIMVNPTQLSEHEFTNWMEKQMEARKNRQERKECPYRSYRKPYNNSEQGTR